MVTSSEVNTEVEPILAVRNSEVRITADGPILKITNGTGEIFDLFFPGELLRPISRGLDRAEKNGGVLTIDFSKVGIVSMGVVAEFTHLIKRSRRSRVSIFVVNVSWVVERAFRLTQMDRYLAIFSSADNNGRTTSPKT